MTVIHTEHWVYSQLKLHAMQPVWQIFTIFWLCRAHVKRYQALPDFLYCKWQKAGTRLIYARWWDCFCIPLCLGQAWQQPRWCSEEDKSSPITDLCPRLPPLPDACLQDSQVRWFYLDCINCIKYRYILYHYGATKASTCVQHVCNMCATGSHLLINITHQQYL